MSAPASSLTLISSRSDREPVGTLALPVRDHVNGSTVISLLTTDWRFLGTQTVDKFVIQGSILPLQRNEAIQRMRGEWLLFIDDDMTWEPHAIERLVIRYHELRDQILEPFLLGGLCFRRTAPYQPTLYMREGPTSGRYNFLESWDSEIVEVDATGCAFLLIPVVALDAISEHLTGVPMPRYEERAAMEGPPPLFRWEGRLGEDLRFCQDAKAAGVRIFVDTTIEIGHVGEVKIGHEHFLQEIALRDPVIEEVRKQVNDRMGLPTLTREEARKRLAW